MNVQAVSFHTGGEYELHAMELMRTADMHDIAIDVDALQPFATWQAAVCHKPAFILRKLAALEDHFDGLLWVDADARFIERPDFSVVRDADFADTCFRWSPSHNWERLTGTIYVRRSRAMIQFVTEWAHVTERWLGVDRDTPEQRSLADTLRRWGNAISVVDLPVTWTWIVPEFEKMYPGMKPVIAHLQASRTLRVT